MSWLPIESAPKDFRSVLVSNPTWIDSDVGRYDTLAGLWSDGGGAVFEPQPTCWQPLPEPPTDDRWELTEAGRAMRGGK